MIENYPWLAICLMGGIFTLGSATLGDARMDLPPEPLTRPVFVHTTDNPVASPSVVEVTSTAVRGTAVQVETTTTIPEPRRWTGPIPAHYGEGSACTPEQATIVAHHMWHYGASDDTVEWMLGTISRESTCDPAAHNGNRGTGDDSWGLCQINALAGWFDTGQLLGDVDPNRFANDFEYNANACARLWSACGRGPWNYGNYYCKEPTS